MKFSIQVQGEEKQFFLSFQEAEKKTGISTLTIARILRSGGKYGISRGTFFQGHRIVALTTVRATI